MMKKFFYVTVLLLIVMCFAGCSETDTFSETSEETKASIPEPDAERLFTEIMDNQNYYLDITCDEITLTNQEGNLVDDYSYVLTADFDISRSTELAMPWDVTGKLYFYYYYDEMQGLWNYSNFTYDIETQTIENIEGLYEIVAVPYRDWVVESAYLTKVDETTYYLTEGDIENKYILTIDILSDAINGNEKYGIVRQVMDSTTGLEDGKVDIDCLNGWVSIDDLEYPNRAIHDLLVNGPNGYPVYPHVDEEMFRENVLKNNPGYTFE